MYLCSDCLTVVMYVFFLMIRRPPRSTQSRSSAASDVYKRQVLKAWPLSELMDRDTTFLGRAAGSDTWRVYRIETVSYTHLRAHETPEHLVCRLLLEKKKDKI